MAKYFLNKVEINGKQQLLMNIRCEMNTTNVFIDAMKLNR